MAKQLLQDMIKRDAPQPKPKPIERVASPEPVRAPEPVLPKPTPPPVSTYTPPTPSVPKVVESPRYSEVETKFASINDTTNNNQGRVNSRHSLWVVASVSVLFLLFALSFLFSGAKVTVNPKVKDLVANESLSAVKDGAVNDLPFELVVTSGEESKVVPAGTPQEVSIRAKGTAIIYNNFSSAPQPLAIDTRLEGSNGKIYKTETKLTVPGMKGTTPGSIEVGIYATEPGEEYNSTPLDFQIVGFKGSPKYEKFYARSKGNITGGFVGQSSDISEEDKTRILAEMKATLKSRLFKKVAEQTPGGFILWENAVVLEVAPEDVQITPKDSDTATMSIKGTLSGFLFEEKSLTEKLVSRMLPTETLNEIYVPNIRELEFAMPTLGNATNVSELENINFSLKGNAKFVWVVDEEKIITELLGKRKKDSSQILAQYPNIESAELVVRPFWKRSFPDEAEDIKVIVNYPK